VRPPLLMAVDGLTDLYNLGAIVAQCEALRCPRSGACPSGRNAGLTGSVAKVWLAGALEHLAGGQGDQPQPAFAFEHSQDEGVTGLSGLAEEGPVSLIEAASTDPLVVVTGSESRALDATPQALRPRLIRIPAARRHRASLKMPRWPNGPAAL